ncbi:hypothetical protein [Buttiauxella gaviniae]|uniref:hypothetical protein n=1 Tax=Buttiauxella gaviniae TaxID=82990 RepID=UPI003976BEFD
MELTFREKFGIQNNRLYLKRYDARQCCRGASFYFLEKVLSGEIINVNTFNVREIELKHKRYIQDKTTHDLDNSTINLLDTELLLQRYNGQVSDFKWLNVNPGDAAGVFNELQMILKTSRHICGTIHLRDHAMAYACNHSNIFIFDPDYGLLKFAKNLTGFSDFFAMVNERRNIRNISIIAQSKAIRIL